MGLILNNSNGISIIQFLYCIMGDVQILSTFLRKYCYELKTFRFIICAFSFAFAQSVCFRVANRKFGCNAAPNSLPYYQFLLDKIARICCIPIF